MSHQGFEFFFLTYLVYCGADIVTNYKMIW